MKLYIKKLIMNNYYEFKGFLNRSENSHYLKLSLSIVEKVKAARDPT